MKSFLYFQSFLKKYKTQTGGALLLQKLCMHADNYWLLCKRFCSHMTWAHCESASVAGRRVQPGCWPVSQQCSQQRQGICAQSGKKSSVPLVLRCKVSTDCLIRIVWLFELTWISIGRKCHVNVLYPLWLFHCMLHAFLCFVLQWGTAMLRKKCCSSQQCPHKQYQLLYCGPCGFVWLTELALCAAWRHSWNRRARSQQGW